MIASVDANIFLDIAGNSPSFYEKSLKLLDSHSASGSLVICPAVYSELLVFFLRNRGKKAAVGVMGEFLDDVGVSLSDFTRDDFILAAEAWQGFLDSKKASVECPKCGSGNSFSCRQCNSPILWRNHVLSDFLIGAHAQNRADVLLTRDRGYYRKYFKVKVLP